MFSILLIFELIDRKGLQLLYDLYLCCQTKNIAHFWPGGIGV